MAFSQSVYEYLFNVCTKRYEYLSNVWFQACFLGGLSAYFVNIQDFLEWKNTGFNNKINNWCHLNKK